MIHANKYRIYSFFELNQLNPIIYSNYKYETHINTDKLKELTILMIVK